MTNAATKPKINLVTFQLSPPLPAERNLDTIIPYLATDHKLELLETARQCALRRQAEHPEPQPRYTPLVSRRPSIPFDSPQTNRQ